MRYAHATQRAGVMPGQSLDGHQTVRRGNCDPSKLANTKLPEENARDVKGRPIPEEGPPPSRLAQA